jgi:hypothetical protein
VVDQVISVASNAGEWSSFFEDRAVGQIKEIITVGEFPVKVSRGVIVLTKFKGRAGVVVYPRGYARLAPYDERGPE